MQTFFKEQFIRLHKVLVDNAAISKETIKIVGLLGIFLYPSYYVYWKYIDPQPWESLGLRISLTTTSVLLLFHEKWPAFFKRHLPILWPLIMAYELPFFATFFLLKNDFSTNWVAAQSIAFFLILVLMQNLIVVFLVCAVGVVTAWFVYPLATGNPVHFAEYIPHVPMFVFAMGVGYVFYFSRNNEYHKQLKAMFSAGTNIAHELKTPLLSLKSGVNIMNHYFSDLSQGFIKAKHANLIISDLDENKLPELNQLMKKLEQEIKYSNGIINSLLVNSNTSLLDKSGFKEYSITECIDSCLARYYFKNDQRALIRWNKKNDFTFFGSEILLTQVIYNLMRNALYFINKAGKGEITLSIQHSRKHNMLIFKDTGTGIPPKELDKIFERFYSTTPDGTGIGLAFCKDVMQSFQGDIRCESIFGSHTTFILTFPVVSNKLYKTAQGNAHDPVNQQ